MSNARVLILNACKCACFRGPHKVKAGQVVETERANNLPDFESKGLRWVTEQVPEECYGLLLHADDYLVQS